MKKSIFYVLVLVLVPQLCFASNARDLKTAMDEYHYFLTVEWDQKDKAVLEIKTTEFETELNELMDQGLSFRDMGNVPEELKTLKLDDRELVLEKLMNHSNYSKGASWNGDILAPAIIMGITAIAIVAFIRYAVKKNRAFDECVELNGGNEQSCIDR